jgi:hypothetical protein
MNMVDTNLDRPNETYSAWSANDYVLEPVKPALFTRLLAALFLIWWILPLLYAETSWTLSPPTDKGVGVGTSAYALVLYARPIALACISFALYLASLGDLIVRQIRVSRRNVFAAADNDKQMQDMHNDDDLLGRRIFAEFRRRFER